MTTHLTSTKTDNYGKRWKRIDEGLPEDAFVRVVREDTES